MKTIKEYVKDCNNDKIDSGLYESINEDNNKVIISIQKNVGADVRTYQNNGWIRVDEYDNDGYIVGTTYAGKWN